MRWSGRGVGCLSGLCFLGGVSQAHVIFGYVDVHILEPNSREDLEGGRCSPAPCLFGGCFI
jgi:hypothetical protein